MSLLNTPIGNFEKPMKIRWCLTYLSVLLFLDCYFLTRFNTGISQISFDFIKSKIDFAESFLLVLSFSLIFAFVVPGLASTARATIDIVDTLTNHRFRSKNWRDNSSEKIDIKNQISYGTLKNIGIIENNYSAYSYAIKEMQDLEDSYFLRMVCQSIVIFSIAGWILSTDSNPSLCTIFHDWIAGLHELPRGFAGLIWFFIFLFIGAIAFKEKPKHLGYAYIPNHGFEHHINPWKRRKSTTIDDEN